VKLTTHHQLVPRSRKRGTIHPLPHTSSLSRGTTFVRSTLILEKDVYISIKILVNEDDISMTGEYYDVNDECV
jgi:hypothetical protein